ncbi:glycosyltransferase family 4 protein [Flavobacterium sp.]|uniref:glycosyltransferase family 4 protein n=1 Tax=Flavobacterium sp. TaxID=239 RepID=UPI003D1372D3
MKKICFLTGDITFGGGAERITISVANLLAKDNDISIITIADFDSARLVYEISPKVKIKSLNIKDWGQKGSIRKHYFSIICLLRNSVKQNEIDILISVQATNMLWILPALAGTKIRNVCWEHINYSSHKSFIYDICIYLAKKKSQKIIVLTERDKMLWNTKKAISISNFPVFNMPCVNIEEKQKLFIAIGRFSPQKAFDRLLDVWELVEKSGKLGDYRLELIGEGEQEFFLRTKIKEKGLQKIEMRPFTNQIEVLYRKASVILMTSLFEGYPMVLIEALQFGIPAVAFDVLTGPAEIILQNKTGFLIEDGNIQEFANAIIKIVNEKNLLEELRGNNLEYRKTFDSESIIKKWNNLFAEIMTV